MVVTASRSDWNSHGSERKIKSGSYFSHIARRLKEILLIPSQFQVRQVNA